MFRTMSQGDSDSVALRKLLQGGRRGSQAIYNFATEGAGSLKLKSRHRVEEFSILCMGRWKPLGSLNSFLSYAPLLSGTNPVSLFPSFLAFPQFLSNHPGRWQHPLDHSFQFRSVTQLCWTLRPHRL